MRLPSQTLGTEPLNDMKVCPYCAESILEAAIVCKHCGRDLTAQRRKEWRRAIIVTVVIFIASIALVYVARDHEQFAAFEVQRDAWHRRCDAYVGKPAVTPEARQCDAESSVLNAYAKSRGWTP